MFIIGAWPEQHIYRPRRTCTASLERQAVTRDSLGSCRNIGRKLLKLENVGRAVEYIGQVFSARFMRDRHGECEGWEQERAGV